MPEIAALVLYAANPAAASEFYRAIGLDLAEELHEEGPVHLAVELGPVHFAIYEASGPGRAPERRTVGDTFAGFYVDSLDEVTAALERIGAPILAEHDDMPWGCRIIAHDPDGRAIEVNQTDHCPAA